ncbi:LysR family transcriptional regulator [Paracoccus limosus]|uniref:LysR family transcriptional regulator n=1 Tax=Paracoccus limosus TaxID=913252 RepID=A0A844H8U5_9RHOB|nr:LysR substrate-binding domain-containing protein [Paracoccus limosus]MTH36294.1 LysR family transcriptional regulator [Paracoccus limosus]
MHDVDLGWIRVFVEVVRAGSLSKAARLLNLTQPAISYQVRRAEEEFGQALLRRRHRGVEPTDAGARLYDILSRSVAQVDELAQRLREAGRKNELRVFTDYAFSGLRLIPRIHEFRDTHPEIDLQVVAAQHTDLSQLRAGDTAVVFGAATDFGPEAVLLMPETVVPVCAPGYGARDLGTAELIHLDGPQPLRWFDWQSYLTATGARHDQDRLRGNMRFNTYSLVIEAALAGQGVALGWRGLIDPLLLSGRLKAVGPELTAPGRGYHMLHGIPRNAATDCLHSWLLAIHRAPGS